MPDARPSPDPRRVMILQFTGSDIAREVQQEPVLRDSLVAYRTHCEEERTAFKAYCEALKEYAGQLDDRREAQGIRARLDAIVREGGYHDNNGEGVACFVSDLHERLASTDAQRQTLDQLNNNYQRSHCLASRAKDDIRSRLNEYLGELPLTCAPTAIQRRLISGPLPGSGVALSGVEGFNADGLRWFGREHGHAEAAYIGEAAFNTLTRRVEESVRGRDYYLCDTVRPPRTPQVSRAQQALSA